MQECDFCLLCRDPNGVKENSLGLLTAGVPKCFICTHSMLFDVNSMLRIVSVKFDCQLLSVKFILLGKDFTVQFSIHFVCET